jgi:hypothetical protein
VRQIQVQSRPLEFILAVPARRYGEFDTLLADFHRTTCRNATTEVVGEFEWQGYRLVVAHCPDLASELTTGRDTRIQALEQEAKRLAGKLEGQDEKRRYRGRPVVPKSAPRTKTNPALTRKVSSSGHPDARLRTGRARRRMPRRRPAPSSARC